MSYFDYEYVVGSSPKKMLLLQMVSKMIWRVCGFNSAEIINWTEWNAK